jgi:hypothetical protein
MSLTPELLVRGLAATVLGAVALVVIVPRLFPTATISLWLLRARRDRRRIDFDMAVAARFHASLSAADRADALDDRTWGDLDLDDVFRSLDRTESEPGRQYLYHLLRTPNTRPEPLEHFKRSVDLIARDETLADRLRRALRPLADPRAAELVHLIFAELPRRPRIWWLFPLLTASSLTCLALIPIWPRAFIIWLGICVLNVCVQMYYKPRVARFVPGLHQVPAFVRASRILGAIDIPECAEETRRLREGADRLRGVRRAATWLMFEPGQTNDVLASVYEYVNLLFLLDVNAFVFAIDAVHRLRSVVRDVFEAMGYLDAVQSVAVWRKTLPQWTTPTFIETRKALNVEAVIHPLLAHPVANSLEVDASSVLITGSNMSGKTTFVRTIGVNAVLAQTLHTVCAEQWRAPMLRVRTSIGRSDSLMDGKSYYLAEVESVHALIRAKETGAQHLFLLDEIFRGTNTTERVAAAYAVLAYLNRGSDIVFVATHDIEVIDLLGDAYTPYHFREEISGDGITFDYRIHPGPASTRNALALLEAMQYPRDLVAHALATIDWQVRR